MKQYKKNISLILFLLVVVAVLILYLKTSERFILGRSNENSLESRNDLSFFTNIRFFRYNSRNEMQVKASELTQEHGSKRLLFIFPDGARYDEEGNPLKFKAERGLYDGKMQRLDLSRDVFTVFLDGTLSSQEFHHDFISNSFFAQEDVKVRYLVKSTMDRLNVKSSSLNGNLNKGIYSFEGNVTGHLVKGLPYEPGVKLQASKMDYLSKEAKLLLNDKVLILHDNMEVRGDRGEVFLENYSKKLKYFTLYDDIRIKEWVHENGQQKYLRKAFCERVDGHLHQNYLELTGFPKVFQGDTLIKGDRITLRKDSETIEVDGASGHFKLDADKGTSLDGA